MGRIRIIYLFPGISSFFNGPTYIHISVIKRTILATSHHMSGWNLLIANASSLFTYPLDYY
jgi:hypothetical protein